MSNISLQRLTAEPPRRLHCTISQRFLDIDHVARLTCIKHVELISSFNDVLRRSANDIFTVTDPCPASVSLTWIVDSVRHFNISRLLPVSGAVPVTNIRLHTASMCRHIYIVYRINFYCLFIFLRFTVRSSLFFTIRAAFFLILLNSKSEHVSTVPYRRSSLICQVTHHCRLRTHIILMPYLAKQNSLNNPFHHWTATTWIWISQDFSLFLFFAWSLQNI